MPRLLRAWLFSLLCLASTGAIAKFWLYEVNDHPSVSSIIIQSDILSTFVRDSCGEQSIASKAFMSEKALQVMHRFPFLSVHSLQAQHIGIYHAGMRERIHYHWLFHEVVTVDALEVILEVFELEAAEIKTILDSYRSFLSLEDSHSILSGDEVVPDCQV